MSEKKLTPRQEDKIREIKKQWMSEAEPFLNHPSQDSATLDGPDSTALSRIQKKYLPKIKEIIEASD